MNRFGPALVISGAVIISASIIANGNPFGYMGIALLVWGIVTRCICVSNQSERCIFGSHLLKL